MPSCLCTGVLNLSQASSRLRLRLSLIFLSCLVLPCLWVPPSSLATPTVPSVGAAFGLRCGYDPCKAHPSPPPHHTAGDLIGHPHRQLPYPTLARTPISNRILNSHLASMPNTQSSQKLSACLSPRPDCSGADGPGAVVYRGGCSTLRSAVPRGWPLAWN